MLAFIITVVCLWNPFYLEFTRTNIYRHWKPLNYELNFDALQLCEGAMERIRSNKLTVYVSFQKIELTNALRDIEKLKEELSCKDIKSKWIEENLQKELNRYKVIRTSYKCKFIGWLISLICEFAKLGAKCPTNCQTGRSKEKLYFEFSIQQWKSLQRRGEAWVFQVPLLYTNWWYGCRNRQRCYADGDIFKSVGRLGSSTFLLLRSLLPSANVILIRNALWLLHALFLLKVGLRFEGDA